MFSSPLSSSSYWKTLLCNLSYNKSAELALNYKNSQPEEAEHPHTASGWYYTLEPLTWDLQTPQVQGSVKIPEFTDSKVAFELRFTHLWPALWALWCGWHRKRYRSWSGLRNTGMSHPEKTGFSVRREGFWEKYIRYHGLRWIKLVMNASEWCTTTVVSKKHGINVTHVQKTWYMLQKHMLIRL